MVVENTVKLLNRKTSMNYEESGVSILETEKESDNRNVVIPGEFEKEEYRDDTREGTNGCEISYEKSDGEEFFSGDNEVSSKELNKVPEADSESNMATASTSESTRLINPKQIFDGNNFEEWEMRLRYGLIREGLDEYIESSEIEEQYREDTIENRRNLPMYKKFRKKDGETIAFLLDRLSSKVMLRVNSSVTAYDMYRNLEILYKTASDVGKDAARQDFYSLRYKEGGDMKLYIEKFEKVADRFRSLGGRLDAEEELEQFRTSLPGSYNHIRNWFSLLGASQKTYENLKRKTRKL